MFEPTRPYRSGGFCLAAAVWAGLRMVVVATDTPVASRFAYRAPSAPFVAAAHERVREICREAATQLEQLLPVGREAALAFTKLQEVSMWGNAAVALTQSTRTQVNPMGDEDLSNADSKPFKSLAEAKAAVTEMASEVQQVFVKPADEVASPARTKKA